jgi:hypothetical protein
MASTLSAWYHRIYERTPPKGFILHLVYHAAGVVAFTLYISFQVWLFDIVRPVGGRGLVFQLTFVTAVLFWWWSSYMLLYRRVPLRRMFSRRRGEGKLHRRSWRGLFVLLLGSGHLRAEELWPRGRCDRADYLPRRFRCLSPRRRGLRSNVERVARRTRTA